ncbi:MAG: hypothetical protein ACE5WD_07315 [Candidatus Aminicenantia bacterium]
MEREGIKDQKMKRHNLQEYSSNLKEIFKEQERTIASYFSGSYAKGNLSSLSNIAYLGNEN